ncbi:MAG: FkbM family methyltransferase [Candidatus Pacebacteria bacterium CG_4_10_14_3_um_filter_34_15]|nr:FkbM family methyltransferase [Candidatus Pacearchaeota archaeon]NCQ65377.1 FkbM family methyltransferase [Candidatus Paceibacterota bacterium]OIO44240.1 MAG: hypothetical protein AUJ41_03605 [Candidatus Pacebacteria bacterium CG1_02_43_31]PIQ80761.1 MAG: FkbM family methyltransferase [Candidatus Pacebacteria bacterium CG11_big_fil_rev_8_21_14_0_20_34_55]PIX81372.1 MAG: FkbM family methyltransferase [Candidatus Pacebacteria bacterium CG_4_10_14_3_um_filter_34_15]PJC43899.1 MAG: FkbM family 
MNILFFKFYRWIFCRPFFYKFNNHLFKLSLRGLGVLNSEVASATGEDYLLEYLSRKWNPKIIIDVGSNTDAYGHKFFPGAKIFAIEPHPQTFKKLKTKFKGISRVKKFNFAMSNQNGQAKLWDFAENTELKRTQPTSQLSSLNRDVIIKIHGQKAQGFKVQKMTLDSFALQQKLAKIDFLKIDTEGHEFQVLQGAKQLLADKKIDIIQFEFNEMNVISGSFLRDFMQILPGHKFFRLMPRGLYSLDDYRPLTHELFGFQNILAVPDDKLDLILDLV